MTSFPESLGPIQSRHRPESRSVGPVQPARRIDDSIHRQRQLAREPVPVVTDAPRSEGLGRTAAEIRSTAPDLGGAYGRDARRAVSAYTGVHRSDDREYVSQVLGVDVYA